MTASYEVNAEFANCNEPTVENTYRLVKSIAHSPKMRSRIESMASVMSVEDVEQELWVAWANSREKFDPSKGVRFSTFYVRMAYWHINRVFDDKKRSVRAVSENTAFGEDEISLFDRVASEGATPEESCEVIDEAAVAISDLSVVAQQVVAWMCEPPAVLLEELRSASWDMTLNRVARFAVAVYELPKQHEARIVREIKNMAEGLV